MRLFAAALVVCAVTAHAQSVNIDLGGFRAGVTVEEAPPAPTTTVVVQQAPPPRVINSDGFRVDYSLSQDARLVVAQPEGLAAQVWSDAQLEGQFATPFSFVGRAGQYYRVILYAADGTPVLDRKVELRAWKQATVTLARQAAAVVVVQQPAPVVVAQPVAMGMAPADFGALLSAVEEEDFSSDKLGVIRSAVEGGAFFSCAQVGQLVDALDMGSDKVEVVQLTRARLVDPNNGFTLLKRFTFSSDKEKVRKLLGS